MVSGTKGKSKMINNNALMQYIVKLISMKYKIITLVSLLLLLTNVYAQKPELRGFYKFNFGISEVQAKNIIESEPDGSLLMGSKCHAESVAGGLKWFVFSFANRPIKSEILNNQLSNIDLYFYKNQFHTARVPFGGTSNTFEEIKSEISTKYFPCDFSEGWWMCKWLFKDGNYIQLNYVEYESIVVGKTSEIVLTYVNKSISDLEKSDKTKENMKFF